MRAVLDTNVLVSACWKPDGLEALTVALAIARAFTLCVSPEVVAEYRDVLGRRKLANVASRATALLGGIERVWHLGTAEIRIAEARDEDDNRFLECAFASRADYLITGNLRHYPQIFRSPGSQTTTRILNARRFLAENFPSDLARIDLP